MAKIALRQEQLKKFRKLKGIKTDAEFAKLIGVNAGQVSRTLRGDSAPGTRFIAGTLELFGVEFFADLFDIRPDHDDDGEAA